MIGATKRGTAAAALRRRLAEEAPGSPYSLARVLAVFAAIMTVVGLASLDQTIVATALPQIVSSLHGISIYSWVFTAYLLFQTVTIPIYGKLGDVYGRRRMLLIAIVVFVSASALCGVAQTMWQLVAFRAVQGIGAGGLIPLAMATAARLVSPRERGRYMALINAGMVGAAVAGPTLGGLIVDNASWRWVFFVNVPVGAFALAVVAATMPAPRERRQHSVDYAGAGLMAAGVGAILLALIWGGRTYPWSAAPVVGTAAAGLALLAAFTVVERRTAEPILDFSVLRLPSVAAGAACWGMSAMCMLGTLAFVPLFTQGVIGASGTSSGLVLMPLMLGVVASSTLAGHYVSRTGRYRGSVLAGPIVLGVGMILLWRMDLRSTTQDVAVNMVVCGLGIGTMNPIFVVSGLNEIPKRLITTATAFLQFARAIGTTLGVTVFGVIVNQGLPRSLRGTEVTKRLPPHTRLQLDRALDPAFLFGVGICGAILAIAFRLIGHTPLRTTLDDPTVAEPAQPTLKSV